MSKDTRPQFLKGYNVADAAGATRNRRHGRIVETFPSMFEQFAYDAAKIACELMDLPAPSLPKHTEAVVRWKGGSSSVENFEDLTTLWTSESPGFKVPTLRQRADQVAQDLRRVAA